MQDEKNWDPNTTILHNIHQLILQKHFSEEGEQARIVAVEQLLKNSNTVMDKPISENWRTPLHLAAMIGDKKMIKLLLSYGANPYAHDNFELTPIEIACQQGDLGVFTTLFNHISSDLNLENIKVFEEKFAEQATIIDAYNDIDSNKKNKPKSPLALRQMYLNNMLHAAIAGANWKIIDTLIAAGADINSAENVCDELPLLVALSEVSDINFISTLVNNYGAKVPNNILATSQMTHFYANHSPICSLNHPKRPEFIASVNKVIDLFINNGAKIDVNHKNYKPLHRAAVYAYPEVINHLVEKGARKHINELSKDGSPLQIAIASKNDDIVATLWDAGAYLDIPDSCGNHMLHIAARSLNVAAVKYILQYLKEREQMSPNDPSCSLKEQVNLRNHWQETPLHLAITANRLDLLKNKDEQVLLERAKAQREIVEALIHHGANPYLRNSDELNCIDITKCQQSVVFEAEVMLMLYKAGYSYTNERRQISLNPKDIQNKQPVGVTQPMPN